MNYDNNLVTSLLLLLWGMTTIDKEHVKDRFGVGTGMMVVVVGRFMEFDNEVFVICMAERLPMAQSQRRVQLTSNC